MSTSRLHFTAAQLTGLGRLLMNYDLSLMRCLLTSNISTSSSWMNAAALRTSRLFNAEGKGIMFSALQDGVLRRMLAHRQFLLLMAPPRQENVGVQQLGSKFGIPVLFSEWCRL